MSDAASNPVDNPYVGPKPFVEAQAGLFFGRDREGRDLLAQVLSERLVLFYAQSGAGKTSLINSRLRPGLATAGFHVLPTGRVSGVVPEGTQPSNIFEFNLISRLESEPAPAVELARLTLPEFLSRNAAMANGPLVLIIDQFEEIFTTRLDQWRARAGFFKQVAAAQTQFPRLWIVLAMREDYIAQLDPIAHLVPNRLQSRFYMQRMSGPAALEAVKTPAENFHHAFAPGVAETLVNTLQLVHQGWGANDGKDLVPGQFVEPVQLQVVCFQLWQRLSERSGWRTSTSTITLDDLGLVSGDKELSEFVNRALREYYEQALRTVLQTPGIEVTERQLRDWFSNKLLTPDGTRALVLQGSQDTGGLPDAVVTLLDAQFLIRAEPRGNSNWYELAHDRLIEPIRESNAAWLAGFLSVWQQQAALWDQQHQPASLLLSGQALADAERWAEANPGSVVAPEPAFLKESRRAELALEKERRQRRWTLAWALLATLFTFIALGASGWAWNSEQSATTAKDKAESAQATAESAQATAESAQATAVSDKQAAQDAQLTAVAQTTLTAMQQAMAASAQADTERALRRLEDQTRIDLARRLAAQANIMLQAGQIDVGVLLSRQANLVDNTPDTRDALATTLGSSPRLIGLLQDPSGPSAALYAVVFSTVDNHLIAAGGLDKVVRLWNTETRQLVAMTNGQEDLVHNLAFSPDGNLLASAGEGRTIRLWNLDGTENHTPLDKEYDGFAHGLAFSPDGTTLAWGGMDGMVHRWNVRDNVPLEPLPALQSQIQNLAFNRDGILAAAGRDEDVRLWDPGQRAELPPPLTTPAVRGQVLALAFTSDGRTLASAGDDAHIRLWDVNAHTLLSDPDWVQEHTPVVYGLAYNRDGTVLASANNNNNIYLWDVSTRQPKELEPRLAQTQSQSVIGARFGVAFSPDGNTLASVGVDGKVWLWDARRDYKMDLPGTTEELQALACRVANRNLTPLEWSQFAGSDASQQGMCPLV